MMPKALSCLYSRSFASSLLNLTGAVRRETKGPPNSKQRLLASAHKNKSPVHAVYADTQRVLLLLLLLLLWCCCFACCCSNWACVLPYSPLRCSSSSWCFFCCCCCGCCCCCCCMHGDLLLSSAVRKPGAASRTSFLFSSRWSVASPCSSTRCHS